MSAANRSVPRDGVATEVLLRAAHPVPDRQAELPGPAHREGGPKPRGSRARRLAEVRHLVIDALTGEHQRDLAEISQAITARGRADTPTQ